MLVQPLLHFFLFLLFSSSYSFYFPPTPPVSLPYSSYFPHTPISLPFSSYFPIPPISPPRLPFHVLPSLLLSLFLPSYSFSSLGFTILPWPSCSHSSPSLASATLPSPITFHSCLFYPPNVSPLCFPYSSKVVPHSFPPLFSLLLPYSPYFLLNSPHSPKHYSILDKEHSERLINQYTLCFRSPVIFPYTRLSPRRSIQRYRRKLHQNAPASPIQSHYSEKYGGTGT